MKKLCVIFLSIILFLFPACTPYKSKYSAVMMMKSNTATSFSLQFEKLSGTYVEKLKNSTGEDGGIAYVVSLEEGEMNVYYDAPSGSNGKTLLFTIKGGESIENRGGYYTNGERVYIIIETVSECKGKLSFSV